MPEKGNVVLHSTTALKGMPLIHQHRRVAQRCDTVVVRKTDALNELEYLRVGLVESKAFVQLSF